ncbi:hypothetical protein V6N12_030568 [Hibiscus sabdariffa]
MINCPYHFADVMVKQVITPNIAWCPPAWGELKFNFDGATAVSFGQSEIGGCLRDVSSKCLLTFSKYVGTVDCTSAEIIDFLEACLIFRKISRAKDFKVIFETDSSLVADWLMNPQRCPLTFKPLIASCLKVCKGQE